MFWETDGDAHRVAALLKHPVYIYMIVYINDKYQYRDKIEDRDN